MLDRSSHANQRSWFNLHQRSSSDLLRRFSFSDLHHQAIFISNFRFRSPNIQQWYSSTIFAKSSTVIFTVMRSSPLIFSNLHRRSSLDLYRQSSISDFHHQASLTSNLCYQSPNIHQRSSTHLRQRFSFSGFPSAIFTITRSSPWRDLQHNAIFRRQHNAIITGDLHQIFPWSPDHPLCFKSSMPSFPVLTSDFHSSCSLNAFSDHLKISRDPGFILFQPIITWFFFCQSSRVLPTFFRSY